MVEGYHQDLPTYRVQHPTRVGRIPYRNNEALLSKAMVIGVEVVVAKRHGDKVVTTRKHGYVKEDGAMMTLKAW